MSERQKPSLPAKGQLERDAADWCVRMHGEEADRWRSDFEAWLKRGALHRTAYNRIEEVYLLAARARRDPPEAAIEPDERTTARPFRRFAWAAAVAIVTVSAAVIGLSGWHTSNLRDKAPTVVASAPGHGKRLTLADGSVVTLGGASAIKIEMTVARRSLTLINGAGEFTVAHAPRPFVVLAGGGSVTARGTTFTVAYAPRNMIEVRLFEGVVDVRRPAMGTLEPELDNRIRLHAGQRIAFEALAPASDQAQPDTNAHQPDTVGALIDLANQNSDVTDHVVVADPNLRDIRLSGSFRVHDPAVVAERLALMLSLRIDRSRPGLLILSK